MWREEGIGEGVKVNGAALSSEILIVILDSKWVMFLSITSLPE